MVSVAQLVELWIVAPAVAGSNPVAHPTSSSLLPQKRTLQPVGIGIAIAIAIDMLLKDR